MTRIFLRNVPESGIGVRKMHEKLVLDSTKAYMVSYNQAMKDTRNPAMAAQIASVVTMSYMTTFKQEAEMEHQAQTLFGMMIAMANEVKGNAREQAEDAEDN